MRWSIQGDKEVISALRKLSQVEYDAVVKLNMTEIYNRGKSRGQVGSTPFITGELRQSLGITHATDNSYDVGYTKEYAPYVEYGHRTPGGGYVQGRQFLKANVDQQRPQLYADILKRLQKAGG